MAKQILSLEIPTVLINGDHTDNDICNLQTLCANCHRLKSMLNKDGAYRYDKLKLKESCSIT